MKNVFVLLFTAMFVVALSLASCDPFSKGSVKWLNDGPGGSHPDTLMVRYAAKDCTSAPITLMLVSDSTGGSHPDTLFVDNVALKPRKKKVKD